MPDSNNTGSKPESKNTFGLIGCTMMLGFGLVFGSESLFTSLGISDSSDASTSASIEQSQQVPADQGDWSSGLIPDTSTSMILRGDKVDMIIEDAEKSNFLTKKSCPALDPESRTIETWGTMSLFSFDGVDTSRWAYDEVGILRDQDGYVVVAVPPKYPYSDTMNRYSIGSVVPTTHGEGKAYTKSDVATMLQHGDIVYQVIFLVTDW